MHGEYKVPGGKLVVVDLEVEAGRISAMRLSGDFFVEPDDAIAAIEESLVGAAADADAARLSASIRDALPESTVMLGFSPEAVATAVRRALAHASTFADYEWQLVRGPALTPHQQLAIDQVLTEEVGEGRRGPTLRFWQWASPAIVIGSFQSVRNEVDLENAERYGFEVVRRISGGGAMVIQPASAITYSLYAPVELVQGMSFAESYAFLDDWVIQALRSLGVDATYQPLNDIASPAGKIGGAAQKRLGTGALLHHVTMAYDMDGDIMAQVLRIGREKLSDKGIKSANKRVDPIKSQTGLARDEVIERLIATFRTGKTVVDGALTEAELQRADALVAEKFATREWLYRVP